MNGHTSTKSGKEKLSSKVEVRTQQVAQRSILHSPQANILALQRSAGNKAVNTAVNSLGEGTPMPMELRSELEQRFGEDFSRVRMHTDTRAAQLAKELTAKAYTFGNNIVFNQGRYTPGTTEGKRLIAHELAHVVQQGRGGSSIPTRDGSGSMEKAAKETAATFAGCSGRFVVQGESAVGIACEPDDELRMIQEEDLTYEKGEKIADKEEKQTLKKAAVADNDARDLARRGIKETGADRAKKELLDMMGKADAGEFANLSTKNKRVLLRKFLNLLEGAKENDLPNLKINLQGKFWEALTKSKGAFTKNQAKWVNGSPELFFHELDPKKRVSFAQPDRTKQIAGVSVHFNDKACNLEEATIEQGRAAAYQARSQAIKNVFGNKDKLGSMGHLPDNTPIIISFALAPSKEVQKEMIRIIFHENSPITEVHFGDITFKRPNPVVNPKLVKPAVSPKNSTTFRTPATKKAIELAVKSPAGAEKLLDKYRVMSLQRLAGLAGVDINNWEEVPGAKVDPSARQVWQEYAGLTREGLLKRASNGDSLATKFLKVLETGSPTAKLNPVVSAPSASNVSSTTKAVKPEPVKPATTPTQKILAPPIEPGGTVPINAPVPSTKPQGNRLAQNDIQFDKQTGAIHVGPEDRIEQRGGLRSPRMQKIGSAGASAAALLPVIEEQLQILASIRESRLAGSLRTLQWWLQRGIVPPTRGVTDRWFSKDEHSSGLNEIASGLQEQKFSGIEVGRLNHSEQYEVFGNWVEANIHNLNDLYQHFVLNPNSGVHWLDSKWVLTTWKWSDIPPANVYSEFEEDEKIKAIMEPVVKRLVTNVDTNIKELVKNPATLSKDSSVNIAGVRKFRKGFNDKSLYSPVSHRAFDYALNRSFEPLFFEISGARDIPEGYALVAGADVRTFALIQDRRAYYDRYSPPKISAPGSEWRVVTEDKPFTGWAANDIDIPVCLVRKDSLVEMGNTGSK